MKNFINKIIQGDCLEVMKEIPDNSVDLVLTDPPYGLEFMGKDWDKFDSKKRFGKKGEEGENDLKIKKNFKILPRFFKSDNNKFQSFCFEWATECLRVLKPGGFLLSFGGTRTYHRMVCGIEDARFEIRDMINYIYGSGFPKSLNVGKQIDKLQGNIGVSKNEKDFRDVGKKVKEIEGIDKLSFGLIENAERKDLKITKGKSIGEGYGTALKPACEPIVVARKPLSEKNVALNVLKWGTGGLNIDGCRIGNREKEQFTGEKRPKNVSNTNCYGDYDYDKSTTPLPAGRFPSNIILDEIAGKMLDEQSGINKSKKQIMGRGFDNSEVYGTGDLNYKSERGHNDKGGASRFFYCAKASKNERGENNNHPTVKPIKLMQYLVRLATPKNGIVLDPFGGSGTTAIACIKEHKNYIIIEKELEYIKITKTRLNKIEKPLNNYERRNEKFEGNYRN